MVTLENILYKTMQISDIQALLVETISTFKINFVKKLNRHEVVPRVVFGTRWEIDIWGVK
jgi:hypothetical protein